MIANKGSGDRCLLRFCLGYGDRHLIHITLAETIAVLTLPNLGIFRQCPKGFRCCDNECCLQRKIWNTDNEPFRILFIISLVRRFCPKYRELQHEVKTAVHQTLPDPPLHCSPREHLGHLLRSPTTLQSGCSEVNTHRTTSSLQPQA